jgi:MFS family permease
VTMAGAAVGFVLYAVLSQRVGRRRFYLAYGVVVLVVGAGAFGLLTTTARSFAPALGLSVVIGLATLGTFGPIAAYLTERFPSAIRATGYGVGYSLALIIPAFYAFYLSGLSSVLPAALGPVVLLVLAGLLVSGGALAGPETRDVDMRDAEHGRRSPARTVPEVLR